jgi:hypothetical protein
MCAQCYATGAALFGETGVLIGGPIAYACYRRTRRALGLRDTAAVPSADQPAMEPDRPRRRPPRMPRVTARTTVRPRLESSVS